MMTTTKSLYCHILVPLENSRVDETILEHVKPLARMCSSRLTIMHVADGFMARNQQRLAESPEMVEDSAYLDNIKSNLLEEGFDVDSVLLCGDPADQILSVAEERQCDLIAMATHGHRALKDVILGSVANAIRHRTDLPVLLVKAPRG